MKTTIRPARHVRTAPPVTRKSDIEQSKTLEDLKQCISGLNSEELEEILNHILLCRKNTTPSSDQQRKLLMWQDSLNTELGNLLGQRERVFPLSMSSQSKKTLKEVQEFMELTGLGNLKTEEIKRMYNLLAKVLVNHASIISSRIKIPLSMKLVLQTTTPLVALFDNHFPGYVKAGLVGKILIAAKANITIDTEDE